jgi:serine kinase of HPr protein (carbohydrate metabolism regulator)
MTLQDIIDQLNLVPLTDEKNFAEIVPTMGYASDMLSCVMVGAANKGIWLTLQAHVNIVAVAALLDLSAVIITEGAKPDAMTLAKANEQQITLLSTPESTYSIAGKLWELGLKAKNS